jgi:hypothetical protein
MMVEYVFLLRHTHLDTVDQVLLVQLEHHEMWPGRAKVEGTRLPSQSWDKVRATSSAVRSSQAIYINGAPSVRREKSRDSLYRVVEGDPHTGLNIIEFLLGQVGTGWAVEHTQA